MRRLLSIIALLSICTWCLAQERKIPFNGILTDFNGKYIKKARVYIKSPRRYVTCNKSGGFGFIDIDTEDTLKISTGGKVYNVALNNMRSVVIKLDPQSGKIQAYENAELFRLGFDHNVRRIGSSNTIISGESLRRSGHSNLLSALSGRVPGLNISIDGTPGGEGSVNIRGINSILCSSTPLFVVDGIVTETLVNISLYDIDYVEVMKEAHIYGARGANGAILVFTKLPG